MAGTKGWVKFTDFEHDGKRYPTRIDTSDGHFEITVPGADGSDKRFRGNDLKKLREQVATSLRIVQKLEWLPVIVFGWDVPWSNGWNGMTFGLQYSRYFRAKSSDGKSGPIFMWRYPAEDNWSVDEITPGKELDVANHPSDEPTRAYGPNVIGYTSDRWKALRKITSDISFFNFGVKEIVGKKDPEQLFKWLGDGSIQKLVVTLDSWGRKDRY